MRVIEPRQLPKPNVPKPKHRLVKWFGLFGIVVLFCYVGVVTIRYNRSLPEIQPEIKSVSIQPNIQPLNLPIYGQVAAGAVGYGQLAKAGDDTPRPMASVAKVLTALVVLDKKPIAKGQSGPVITLDEQDVTYYNDFVSIDGSVAPVAVGEQITEYQALQALLLPSANNMADSLARWAYGSQGAFITAANEYSAAHGFSQTSLADASGFSPKTVSTATDLIKLGELALKNEVVAEITSQSSATIPVAGNIKNVNWLLGQDGIDGIKTGNTDQAGGCFLSTVLYKHPSGNEVRLIVAVMGAGNLNSAMQDAKHLLSKISEDFGVATLKAGTEVGFYNVPWSHRVAAVTESDTSIFRWQGTAARSDVSLEGIKNIKSGSQSDGTITLIAGPSQSKGKVKLAQAIPEPNWRWRFWHAVTL